MVEQILNPEFCRLQSALCFYGLYGVSERHEILRTLVYRFWNFFVCGVAGFLSNPAGAKTALISGGTFGFLSALSGVLMSRGIGWAWMAALGCTGFLAAVFTWRAAAGWMAYSTGQPKLFAASLITLMLAGSLISIGVLVKNRHRG